MKYLLLLLLSCCYTRSNIESEPARQDPAIDTFENCQFVCGFVKFPIMCSGRRHVIKQVECNIVHETFHSNWRDPKEYIIIQDICTWNYIMSGPCVRI